MKFEKIENNGIAVAKVSGDAPLITDVESALDILMSAKYNVGSKNIVMDKKYIVEDLQVKYFKNISTMEGVLQSMVITLIIQVNH